MGCAGAKANAVSTAVAQKVRAQRERSRQKFARGPKSETGRQSFASLVHALAPVLEEQESRRGVIWSQSEDCFQSLSVDPDSFNEGDLEVLRERPWQQMWRIHLQEYEDGANQLQEDTELPAMDTLLETMRDGNDEAVKASLPQLKRFRALQRLLSLQEDLASLARKVALSLASEAQWPQLALVLQKSGAEVQASNLLSMALTGFHLQGVFFRMVVDEDDWKTICAEVRMARQSKGPLLLALEGMGVRLLASPVLNECAKDEASIKRTSRILLDYCQQLRYGHQEETELWKAAQKLPNPRKLLSLEVPLARAIGALPQSLRPSVKASECLALVFGVPPGELTSLRCGKPEVLVSDSTAGLLEEVATCLRCLSWRLKRSDVHGLFGCPCEVWYLPEAEGDPAAPAIWEWQSNRFAVLFTSAAPQFPLSEDSSSLVERLHSVAQQLSTEPGMAQHGRALRSLLREQQLPARFAPAVAELKLLGVQHLLVKNQALVEEAASVELMSRAAKHAVRHILTHRQMLRAASSSSPNGCNGCAAEVFFGQLGPKRKEVVDTPLQRLWAVDADGDWMQLIAKEAQLLSTEDSIGADAAEAPIPPIPPQEKREVKSDEAELEAQLMLSALQVNPDATSEEQMQLAALRQGLLQVVFWVRLASMAHELSLTAAEPRDKDPSRASSVSTAESEAPRTDLSTSLSLLRALGHRLMAAARRRPLALAAATAGELRISLPREFTIRLRVHALQLNAPMRVPIGPSATTSSSSSIQLHFRCTAPLSYEEAFSEVLQADLPGDPAKPLSASGKLAALLLTNRDLSLGRGRVGLLQRSPELLAPSVSVVWKLAAATAVLRPGDATTAYGVKHKAWTAKTLLQVVHYQLLSSAADSGNQEEAAFLAKQLQTLKAAAQILGELGISCPAELFASFFTLRGMICEREGDVDACYLHYLQALARLDDAWGDPRKPGGRGHPFAAFLVWKLGLISYCRSDTKCIVKFGDYFRSLVLSFEDVPFSWGPGSSGDVSEPRCLELLRREARPEAAQWCWRHDVLNVLQEGLLPAPCTPAADELSTVANHHSITGDRQDVFRGTVFACGVNELGQLGTGRDLPWSGAPLRVVALKEVRIKEVACGEAHCIALDLEGHLHAWGFDEFCQVGGTHFVASPLSSPRCPGGRPGFRGCKVIPKPRQLQVGTSFVRVACGAQFSLALDSSGQVWSWGHGEGGVLGLGPSLTARAEPTKVLLEKGYSWASWVACGSYHAFAVCEGQLYSWGRTEGGQLGLASEVIEGHIEEHHLEDSCVCLPHPVLNLPPIRSAAGGDVHSLALDETGEIYSWGWGEFGQLGLGFSSSSFQVGMGGASSRRPLPQHLPLDRKGRALQVACGGAFSAALLGQDLNDGGQLLMWGANDVGQCGLPAKKPIDIASPTEVPGLRNIPIRLVACGTCHAVAIDLNGQAFSWGAQQFGKLGRSDAGITATFDGCDEPELLRSMARLRLARVACGLHHSLLVTEVSGRRRSSNDSTTEEGVTEVSSGSQYAKT